MAKTAFSWAEDPESFATKLVKQSLEQAVKWIHGDPSLTLDEIQRELRASGITLPDSIVEQLREGASLTFE